MLDIVACPIDKHFPLELFEISIASDSDDVIEGALFCDKCKRFYLIIEGIPVMLPDELREKQKETGILMKWRDVLPNKITQHGNPWHL